MLPLVLLAAEILEGAALLSVLAAMPERIESLLMTADLATLIKMPSYLAVFVADGIAAISLLRT